MNLSIGYCEEGNYIKAFETLKEGYAIKLKEEPNIELYNDFQLHFIYLIHKFVEYDSSKQAKEIKELHKNYLKNLKDEEAKLIIINNKIADDRLLLASNAYKQLSEIKIAKTSTHEITIKINKILLLLKQKNIEEAKKEQQEIIDNIGDDANIKDERFFLITAYISLMY